MALLLNLKNPLSNVLKIKNIHFSRCISITPNLLWFNKRLTRSSYSGEREKRYMEKDKVPQHYDMIYRAPMESYVVWATHVSTVTAAIISIAAIYQFAKNQPLLEPLDTTLIIHSDDIYYFTAGFLAINIILRLVVSIFPLRIYKNQENYIAVYHPQLPLSTSHHHFKQGEVKPVYYAFSPWNNFTYKLGNRSSLLLEHYFKTASKFHELFENIAKK